MTDPTTSSTWAEINAYAQANHRAALELWNYVFPPRPLKWHRRAKEIKRRAAVTRAVIDAKKAAQCRP